MTHTHTYVHTYIYTYTHIHTPSTYADEDQEPWPRLLVREDGQLREAAEGPGGRARVDTHTDREIGVIYRQADRQTGGRAHVCRRTIYKCIIIPCVYKIVNTCNHNQFFPPIFLPSELPKLIQTQYSVKTYVYIKTNNMNRSKANTKDYI